MHLRVRMGRMAMYLQHMSEANDEMYLWRRETISFSSVNNLNILCNLLLMPISFVAIMPSQQM
jgi:hypothetical protein